MPSKAKWNKADSVGAARMGWRLVRTPGFQCGPDLARIERHGDRFKSDDEAIEWVMHCFATASDWTVSDRSAWDENQQTCRKALFLCARG